MDANKIQKFRQAALAQGYSPEEVESFVRQKTASVTKPVQQAPVQQPQPGLASKIGSGIINVGKEVAKPFVNTATNIGTAGITIPQAVIASLVSRVNKEAGAKIASKDILGTQSQAREISKDPKKAFIEQAKDSAEVASYAIPFGKGKNIATKALLPGAGVGAVQGLAADEVTPEGVIGSAALGAGGAAVLHGLSKIPGVIKGAGQKIEKAGTKARTGNVTLKSSLSGAADEKAVTATLEKYGVKGTPQKRYEMLEPTVKNISASIDDFLAPNAKQVTRDQLEAVFNKKIAPIVEQGDLTLPEAQQAFKTYLDNVMAVNPQLFENGISNTQKLFALKKNVQAATTQVAAAMRKAENKSTLTPTQKSMKAIRDSLDEMISTLNPEVKDLTMDQSRLYDAVIPISNQRKTVPTIRALGITIPKGPTNAAIDLGGNIAEKTGAGVQTVGGVLPNIAENTLTGQVASRLPLLTPNNGQDNLQNPESKNSQDNTASNVNQSLSPPIGGELPPLEQNYITGYSPEQIYAGYQAALNNGDNQAAEQLRQMYEDEIAYQKANNQKPAKLTELDKKFAFAGQEAEKALNLLNTTGVQTGKIAAGKSKIKEFLGTQDPSVTAFKSQAAIARTALMNALLGANMSPQEVEKIADFVFDFAVEPAVIQQRLQSFIQSMQDYSTNIAGPESNLPPIDLNPVTYQ